MRSRPSAGLATLVAILVMPLLACTHTYTKAELHEQERKLDREARAAETGERNAEELGGRNMEAMDESMGEAEMESER